jgi:hypothetical protein
MTMAVALKRPRLWTNPVELEAGSPAVTVAAFEGDGDEFVTTSVLND